MRKVNKINALRFVFMGFGGATYFLNDNQFIPIVSIDRQLGAS